MSDRDDIDALFFRVKSIEMSLKRLATPERPEPAGEGGMRSVRIGSGGRTELCRPRLRQGIEH